MLTYQTSIPTASVVLGHTVGYLEQATIIWHADAEEYEMRDDNGNQGFGGTIGEARRYYLIALAAYCDAQRRQRRAA